MGASRKIGAGSGTVRRRRARVPGAARHHSPERAASLPSPKRPLKSRRNLGPRPDLPELRLQLAPSHLYIVGGLGTKPISIGKTEEPTKPQIGIRSDGAPPQHDLPDSLSRYPGLLRQAVLRDSHGLKKLFLKKLTRSNGGKQAVILFQLSDSRRSRHLRHPHRSIESRFDTGR